MPKLIIVSEAGPATHELADEVVTIGRAEDNLIRITDGSVSGRHARLERVGEIYHLKDLGSTNGTRVNGEAVEEHVLRVGDRVRFGKVEAHFESDVTGEAQPLPQLAGVETQPASASAKPVDFANASPFPTRTKANDPTRLAFLAGAGLALLVFLASMVAVFRMSAPGM